jgi:YHS domain-containing protein
MKAIQVRAFERVAGLLDRVGWANAVRDPVCGMPLARSALRFTYEGRSFPFCSFRCVSLFKEDPERFLSAAAPRDDERYGMTTN